MLRSLGLDATADPDLYDIPQEPYPMPGNASNLTTGSLADPTSRFLPIVWPNRGQKISQAQRVKGNYPLDGITFSSPQSNVFRVYNLELKQWSLTKCAEMVTAMGIDPNKVVIAPKTASGMQPTGAQAFCLPRSIFQRAA
jgi:hypothetical protein